MSIEQTVQKIFKDVLDVEATEISPDQPLSKAFGVDSTEMVEITVGIKKALGLNIENNAFGKDHTYNQIVEICKAQKVS